MPGWRQKAARLIGDIKEEYLGECRFVKLRTLMGFVKNFFKERIE
jgi:hypothetical protein